MSTKETKGKTKKSSNSATKEGIKNHKTAATHLKAAAKSHLSAAKHHKNGNDEKAEKSTIKAHGHVSLANEVQKTIVAKNAVKG